MKTQNLVLFDMDGTLVDSMDRIFHSVCRVFVSQGVKPPTFETYLLTFGFPYEKWYWDLGVKLSSEEIWKIYSREHGEYNPPFFHDALTEIHKLRETNFRPIIVTANSCENVLKVLKLVDLADLIECKSASDKSKAIGELVKESALGERTPYVGDIVADMADARKAGARPVAILRNGMMRLAQEYHDAGASICINSLSHLTKVVLR